MLPLYSCLNAIKKQHFASHIFASLLLQILSLFLSFRQLIFLYVIFGKISRVFELLSLKLIEFLVYLLLIQNMKLIKKNEPKVLNKKIEGDKVYYLVVKNRSKKWIDFEHLDEYLELVMEYEKLQQQSNQAKKQDEKPKYPPPSCSQKLEPAKKTETAKSDVISNLIFLNKVENDLFFKVFYVGGESEVMNNKVLSLKHPQEMIAFYEKHIKIEEDTA